jgi:hypothetical protein
VLKILFVFVIALFGFGQSHAKPNSLKSVLGQWQVDKVIVTAGMSNSQLAFQANDTLLIGRRLVIGEQTFRFLGVDETCPLDQSQANKRVSFRTLFSGEKLRTSNLVTTKFYQKQKDYALGELANTSIGIYAYQCIDKSNPANQLGGWFGLSKGHLIWPMSPDAVLVLSRPTNTQSSAQKEFCSKASSAEEKIICNDGEMWLMYRFSNTVKRCIEKSEIKAPARLTESYLVFERTLATCNGQNSCIYQTLNDHVANVSQDVKIWPEWCAPFK